MAAAAQVMAAEREGAAAGGAAAAEGAALRAVVAQELGGAVVASALAAHAQCGSWARVGELVALVRREQIALEGSRVQEALERATEAKQWETVLELVRLPCVAASGARAPDGASAGGVALARGGGVAASAVDGDAPPFLWSRRSVSTALRACHQLGDWRQAVALLADLQLYDQQLHAEQAGAAAGGAAGKPARGAAGGAAAVEAMAELRRQAAAADGSGSGSGDGDGGPGGGVGGGVGGAARVVCGEAGLEPGCFSRAMNACLTSGEAAALELAVGPLLAAAEAAGCANPSPKTNLSPKRQPQPPQPSTNPNLIRTPPPPPPGAWTAVCTAPP